MPAKSKKQQKTAGMALAMKRGQMPHKPGPAHEMMMSMGESELHKMASTKRKGLPVRAKGKRHGGKK